MAERRFFLSYSRQELYFAQAVAQHLRQSGLDVWFDIEQLEPGCDWKAEIAAGLDSAADLILIVSAASLKSAWVAKEWQKAQETGRPIHLVIFEAVTFAPCIADDGSENGVSIDPTPLPAQAVTIIDTRRDFKETMSRLIASLTGDSPQRDAIPAPNRWNLPEKMPAAVAFVAGSLGVLALLTLAFTLITLRAYLPLMLAGFIATGGLIQQMIVFLRRESFLGARIALLFAPLLVVFFAFPIIPLFIAAAWVAFRSPDVHRWSPLGQGLTHGQAPQTRQMATAPGDGCVMLLIPFLALVIIEPLMMIPAFILMLITARQTRRRGVLRKTPAIGQTVHRFRVNAVASDQHIAQDVTDAMESAGHLSATKNVAVDFEILVATNQTDDYFLARFKPGEARTLVVVGSGLDDPKRFRSFADYQWIDYRRRDPARLHAMANDLHSTHGDTGNSYSTRTVPQDFRKLLLPRTVAWYMVVQFFFYNLFFVSATRSLLDTGKFNAVNLASLMYGLGATIVSVWMINRIMRREIHISRIAWINLGIVFFGACLGFFLGLTLPIPSGMQRDPNALRNFLIINALGALIGYNFGKFYLRLVLGRWLPLGESVNHSGFPAFQRDSALWRRNLISAVLTVLVTLGFLGGEIPANTPSLPPESTHYQAVSVGSLRLDVPSHWIHTSPEPTNTSLYTRNVPISAILRQSSGPFNESAALATNSIFQGGLGGGILGALGQPISGIFDNILSTLTGDFDWDPRYYGNPQYSLLYAEGEHESRQFVMTVWDFAPSSSRAILPSWQASSPSSFAGILKRGTSSTPTLQFIGESARSLGGGVYLYEVEFSGTQTGTATTYRVAIYDSPLRSYFITFSGGASVLESQRAVIDSILASGRVE